MNSKWGVGVPTVVGAFVLALLPVTPAEAAAASVRVGDITVTERDSAGIVAKVPVKLSRALNRRVTVSYRTLGGTATAPSDYTATTGKAAIKAGNRQTVIRIAIKGDTKPESVERFRVRIGNPVGAAVADAFASVTIKDDDVAAPTVVTPSPCPAGSDGLDRYVRIGDVARPEGWTPDNLFKFAVELSAPSAKPVCVDWSTQGGDATAGTDYTTASGTLVFPAGETLKRIGVAVRGDIANEPDETFQVKLGTTVNATVPYGIGTGTILNDDCGGENEGLSGATALGEVLGDVLSPPLQVSERICTGDVDWYVFDLREFGGDSDLTARIDLAVGDAPAQTGGDLDLAVYNATGALVGTSDRAGTEDEQVFVKKADTAAYDDTKVYVRVSGYGGNQVNTYTLTVTGDVTTGIAPNL